MVAPRPDAPRNEHKTFIPEAVRRASENADRIHKDVYPDDPKPGDAPQEPQKPAEPTHPQPPHQEAKPQEQPQQPSQEPPRSDPDFKRMFESEQGRNQKLRGDISQLSSEVTQLRQLISTMKDAEANKPTPQGNVEIDVKTLLSAEEQQEWGEVLPVIEKVARGMVAPLQQQLQDRINSVDAKVTTVREHASVSDRQRMISQLDDPNNPINRTDRQWGEHGGSTWRDINTDEEFVGWLQYPDPLSGQKRHDMLKQAFDANDASRVAAFFANFLREVAAVAPPTAQPVPQNTNGSAAPGLEQYAAPGRGRTGAPPSSAPEAEIITTGDIAHFFATKTAGKWKGREAEADTFERKIFASQSAQQVRAGPVQHPELVRIR